MKLEKFEPIYIGIILTEKEARTFNDEIADLMFENMPLTEKIFDFLQRELK